MASEGHENPVRGEVQQSSSKESLKGQELIEEALKVGRSSLSTWAIKGGASHLGFQNVYEEQHPDSANKNLGSALDLAFENIYPYKDRQTDKLVKQSIREVIIITPLRVDITEIRKKQIPYKSFFRTKYRDVEEEYVSGQRPQLMSEIAEGQAVPAAAVYYYASDRSLSVESMFYRDGARRPGNSLNVKVEVPLELAKQISQQIQREPTFMRRLTDAFVQAKYSRDFKESTWETFGRPPYDRWDLDPNNRIYFVDLIESPHLPKIPIEQASERTFLIRQKT